MLFNTPVTLFPFVVHVGQPLITSGLVLTLLSDVQLFHYLYSIVIFISPNIDETSLELSPYGGQLKIQKDISSRTRDIPIFV